MDLEMSQREIEDGTGFGGLVESKVEREARRAHREQMLKHYADGISHGFTLAIQHLNSSPYSLTKDECIELLRSVRSKQQL